MPLIRLTDRRREDSYRSPEPASDSEDTPIVDGDDSSVVAEEPVSGKRRSKIRYTKKENIFLARLIKKETTIKKEEQMTTVKGKGKKKDTWKWEDITVAFNKEVCSCSDSRPCGKKGARCRSQDAIISHWKWMCKPGIRRRLKSALNEAVTESMHNAG